MSRQPLCPAGRCAAGSTLLGIRGPGGELIYTPHMPPLDEAMAERFQSGGGTAAFRFSEPCAEEKCGHWESGACGVASAAASAAPIINESDAALPRCSIRANCRWFAQEGRSACGVCPLVARDNPLMQESLNPLVS